MAPIFESFSNKVHTQKGICCLFVICGPERGLTLMADYDKSSYVSSSWVLSICESGGPQTKPPKTYFVLHINFRLHAAHDTSCFT